MVKSKNASDVKETHSSRRLPIVSNRSIGTVYGGIVGIGAGGVADTVIEHITRNASCCLTVLA